MNTITTTCNCYCGCEGEDYFTREGWTCEECFRECVVMDCGNINCADIECGCGRAQEKEGK